MKLLWVNVLIIKISANYKSLRRKMGEREVCGFESRKIFHRTKRILCHHILADAEISLINLIVRNVDHVEECSIWTIQLFLVIFLANSRKRNGKK